MTVEGVYVARPSAQADDFADYLTEAAAAKVLAVEGRQTPANQQVYDPAVGGDPILKHRSNRQPGPSKPLNFFTTTLGRAT
jgi:arabinogalactan oligomer / maltooligosaccharide transport system substrate-binding protein